MNEAIIFTPYELWGWILAICAGIVTISGAVTIVMKAIKAAKKPTDDQNERLNKLEERVNEHDTLFRRDSERLKSIEDGNRVTQQALLALLDHGLDGNNLEQMRRAKDDLQKHLIER